MNDYIFSDAGQPVPTLEEMQRKLGPHLCALMEQRLTQLRDATGALQINTLSGYLQGMYNAAAILGRMDKRLAQAHCKAVIAIAEARMRLIRADQSALRAEPVVAECQTSGRWL